MVKARRKQPAAIAAERESLSAEDDSWVVVKKQRITILVPPASPVQTLPQLSRMKRLQTKARKTATRTKTKRQCRQSWSKQKKSTSSLSKKELHSFSGRAKASSSNDRAGAPSLTNDQLPKFTFETVLEGSDLLLHANFPVTNKPSNNLAGAFRAPNRLSEAWNRWPSSSFAILKQQNFPPGITGDAGSFCERSLSCLNVGALQNQKIRASNIERKLESAGGLSRWLVSQGLGQFIQLFKRENVDKIQLLNLTMHNLKDMGADAVGPRRKLIHAIDCLCQPYYF